MIYLDNAATTSISPAVLESMMPYLTHQYGNPGSLHAMGREAAAAVEKARQQVADFLHCKPEQVIFTSGGSEGNNLVLKGLSSKLKYDGRTHLVVSKTEHDSVYKAAIQLCMKDGFHVTFVSPENGIVTEKAVAESLTQNTGLVSVMMVNNEVGTVNHVQQIGELCSDRGILFHTDAVQAAGERLLEAGNYDFLTISSHKIHGPKGVGALYAREPAMLLPLISGGADQEHGVRGGTENVAGIVGFGTACEIAGKNRLMNLAYAKLLRCYFQKVLQDHGVYDTIIHEFGYEEPAKTLNIAFPGVDAQTLLLMLDSQGVCVSAGSACRAHEHETSRTLLSMGISKEEADSSIRVSFSDMNTVAETETAASILAECVKTLRSGDVHG